MVETAQVGAEQAHMEQEGEAHNQARRASYKSGAGGCIVLGSHEADGILV